MSTLPVEISPDLKRILKRLKLSRILDTLPERLRLARERSLPHQDLLELVLGDEALRRDGQAARMRADKAGLDAAMVLEAWDGTAKVTFDRALLEELATLRFVDAHHSVLILGPVGVGKTFLAHALGHIACRRGYSVLLSSTEKLLKRLKAARLDQSHEEELRRLITVDLLILDDFGMGPLDPLETHDVFDIISERHQKHSLVVTSNRDPAEWMLLMADPLRAQACLDRLVNSAYDLVIEGESYRKRLKPTRSAVAG